MAVTSGKPREKIAITISHGNKKRIDEAIARGEFSNVSETINEATTFFFNNRERVNQLPAPIRPEFKDWLVSEDGKKYLKDIIRQVKDEI
jgi:Arc/MetJ-type ribon-helix-helix transcriptional regulator